MSTEHTAAILAFVTRRLNTVFGSLPFYKHSNALHMIVTASMISHPFLIFGRYTVLKSDECIRGMAENWFDQLRLGVATLSDLTLERTGCSSYALHNKAFSPILTVRQGNANVDRKWRASGSIKRWRKLKSPDEIHCIERL